MSDLPPGYFTARELAVLLKCSVGHVHNLASKHHWRRVRVGRVVGYHWHDAAKNRTDGA